MKLAAVLERYCPESESNRVTREVQATLAYRNAIRDNQLDNLSALGESLTLNQIQTLIKADDYHVLNAALRKGNLPMVQYLAQFCSKAEITGIVRAHNCLAIRNTIAENHVEMAKFLAQYCSADDMKSIVCNHDCLFVRHSFATSNLQMLRFLEPFCPVDRLKCLAKENDYFIFEEAIRKGNLELIKLIETLLTQDEITNVLTRNNRSIIMAAHELKHMDVYSHIVSHLANTGYFKSFFESYLPIAVVFSLRNFAFAKALMDCFLSMSSDSLLAGALTKKPGERLLRNAPHLNESSLSRSSLNLFSSMRNNYPLCATTMNDVLEILVRK